MKDTLANIIATGLAMNFRSSTPAVRRELRTEMKRWYRYRRGVPNPTDVKKRKQLINMFLAGETKSCKLRATIYDYHKIEMSFYECVRFFIFHIIEAII